VCGGQWVSGVLDCDRSVPRTNSAGVLAALGSALPVTAHSSRVSYLRWDPSQPGAHQQMPWCFVARVTDGVTR